MRKRNLDKLDSLLPNSLIKYLKNGGACSEKNKIALQKLLKKV